MYSEMLGNKYFLARNYQGAAQNLQFVLSKNPINKSARKKIIICYTQTGEIEKAFDNFYTLVKEDIHFIIDTDPVADDCPCPDLVAKYGKVYRYEKKSYDLKLMLGMLWLYCDVYKSWEIFDELNSNNDHDFKLKEVLSLIEQNKKSINKNTN
ncbi:MAG: tetratricopeptide repeat protein [Ignavibacteria bacterium]|nr:tetratricopeptide repeat protein [Ignavibacteria bacterium]MBT8390259.1 tetratricopeptide repeat protein [Ignavibacteria bacterium]